MTFELCYCSRRCCWLQFHWPFPVKGVAHQLLSVNSFLALTRCSLSSLFFHQLPDFERVLTLFLYLQLPHCTTSVSYNVSLRPVALTVNPLCDACVQRCPRFITAETCFLLPCIIINETARPVVDCGRSCLLCVQSVTNYCVISFIGWTYTFISGTFSFSSVIPCCSQSNHCAVSVVAT